MPDSASSASDSGPHDESSEVLTRHRSAGEASGSGQKPKRRRIVTEARREQNRLAQQNLRQRKDQRLTELEDQLEEERKANQALRAQVEELRGLILSSMGGSSSARGSVSGQGQVEVKAEPVTLPDPAPPRPPSNPQFTIPAAPTRAPEPEPSRALVDHNITMPPSSSNNWLPNQLPSTTTPNSLTSASSASSFPLPQTDFSFFDPSPSWLTDLFSTPYGPSDTVTDFTKPMAAPVPPLPEPGQWAMPDLQLAQEPYNIDNLEFLLDWNAGNLSLARGDQSMLDIAWTL